MRKLLLILSILLIPVWVWPATYYVDCNANGDAGTGLTTALDVAWKTIAKVNASSFAAGDSILFNKGCTWREQLIIPSSGSDGSPITFGAYGSGVKPIIYGSKLASVAGDWTQDSLSYSGDLSNWTETDTANKLSTSTTADHGGGGGYGVQIVNDNTTTAAYLTKTFTATYILHWVFYIKFTDGDNWSDGKYIGMAVRQAVGDWQEVYIERVGTNMQLYSRLAGSDTLGLTTICASNNTDWHKIEFQLKCDTGGGGYHKVWFDDVSIRNSTGLTTSDMQAISLRFGYAVIAAAQGSNATYFDDIIITDGTTTILSDDFQTASGDTNLWYTASTVNSGIVWKDGTRMTKVTNKVDIGTDATKWWYDDPNDRVYVYGGGSAPVGSYEIAQRDNGIVGTDKTDIKIQNIDLKYGNDAAIEAIRSTGTVANWEVDSSSISGWYHEGVFIGSGADAHNQADGAYIHGCTITDIGGDSTNLWSHILVQQGDSFKIQNNTITFSANANNNYAYGILTRFTSNTGGSPVPDISGNTISGILVASSGGAIILAHAYYANVYNNTISTNIMGIRGDETSSEAGDGISNCSIYKNSITLSGSVASTVGIYMENSPNNSIYYNIIKMSDLSAFANGIRIRSATGGNSNSTNIYNNTIVMSGIQQALTLGVSSDNVATTSCNVKNNIFYAGGTGGVEVAAVDDSDHSPGNSHVINSNLYYRVTGDPGGFTFSWFGTYYNDIATFRTASSQETDGKNGDPLFVSTSDFHLQSTSPAINAGVDVGLASDYEGNVVPKGSGPDIGVYEKAIQGSGSYRGVGLGRYGSSYMKGAY